MAACPRFRDCVAVVKEPTGVQRIIRLEGRSAECLRRLVKAGTRGVTQLEVTLNGVVTTRLGAVVHRLRHDYGLDVLTEWDEHDGGRHGRYVLLSRVHVANDTASGEAA